LLCRCYLFLGFASSLKKTSYTPKKFERTVDAPAWGTGTLKKSQRAPKESAPASGPAMPDWKSGLKTSSSPIVDKEKVQPAAVNQQADWKSGLKASSPAAMAGAKVQPAPVNQQVNWSANLKKKT